MDLAGQPSRILIIDDDVGLARILEKLLKREGHLVASAASGEEALAWLEHHEAALMLLDLQLPDFAGPDLINRLETIGRAAPFIIITGQGDERVAVEMMKRGALDYLIKDMQFLQFVPTVVTKALAQIDNARRLAAAEAGRRQLEREILEISEREQRRIGQDLHDDLGQHLAGVWCLARVLESSLVSQKSPEAESAAKINSLLKDALALTRALARGLHPVAVESGGLAAALEDLTRRTSDMFRVKCGCKCAPLEPMANAAAAHLFRIAQEAVTNAVKHGRAKNIEIEISANAHQIVLSVKDDGVGLPPSAPEAGGMGVRIMRFRADSLGGRLDIANNGDGPGALVRCTVPTPHTQ